MPPELPPPCSEVGMFVVVADEVEGPEMVTGMADYVPHQNTQIDSVTYAYLDEVPGGPAWFRLHRHDQRVKLVRQAIRAAERDRIRPGSVRMRSRGWLTTCLTKTHRSTL
jgi:hypothetical protein